MQHLGPHTTGPSLTIERFEDQPSRLGQIAFASGIRGLTAQASGLIQPVLAGLRLNGGRTDGTAAR